MKGSIGSRIKKLRDNRGWTLIDLGDRAKINKSVLSRIESGKRPVQAEELRIFAQLFNVSSDYLLGRTDDPLKSLSQETKDVLDNLDLTDEEIRNMFPFEIDGRPITDEEFKWFIASVRSRRLME